LRRLRTGTDSRRSHRARFTGGNFATISLPWDWMFGTLDTAKGYGG
jgi:sterol desaturase/sphingolipid hydroxylase (fatty acid hydroxylase superfamily)